jgi:hypothetical protein
MDLFLHKKLSNKLSISIYNFLFLSILVLEKAGLVGRGQSYLIQHSIDGLLIVDGELLLRLVLVKLDLLVEHTIERVQMAGDSALTQMDHTVVGGMPRVDGMPGTRPRFSRRIPSTDAPTAI